MSTVSETNLISKLKGTNIDLDFDKIKDNLKEYLSAQNQFTDYDFEASGINILLDVLAYTTQMNAMTAHLGLNEIFIDSAQARPNLVSIVKNLGYTPNSVSAAEATINLSVVPALNYSNETLSLNQFTEFSGGGLSWFTTEIHTATKNSQGYFYFPGVVLREGSRKIVRHYYDSRVEYPKYEIPDRDVDTTTLQVRVRESNQSDVYTSYTKFHDFSLLSDTSAVYFLEENSLGLFEIYFTGGAIGYSPENGNIIEIEYFYSNGAAANGIINFSNKSPFTGSSETVQIVGTVAANGGGDKESLESIRFNAPYYFQAQNRCVSIEDYATILKKEVPQISTVNVWGGEIETPPKFGQVFIAVKPNQGEYLSSAQKENIIESVLKPRKVGSILPTFVDADYTYIGLNVTSKYDYTRTSSEKQEIADAIRARILQYNENNLNEFNSIFRFSKLLSTVDNTESAITNSAIQLYLVKTQFINSSATNSFNMVLPVELYDYDPDDFMIKSNSFLFNGKRHFIGDRRHSTDSSKRTLDLIYVDNVGSYVTTQTNVGQVDLEGQIIEFYNILPDINTYLKVYINPKTYDIISYKNQIISIDSNELSVTVEKDYNKYTPAQTGPVRFNTPYRNNTMFER